ncbi:MAG: GNAT family N-acetyltransferase [Alphaproteobacteria bacterium]|nr:GNAT family N-acetyltransferase [Alphaproteobacteria bacterium]
MNKNIQIREANFTDVKQIAAVHSVSAYKAYDHIMSKEILEGFWNPETLEQDWHNYISQTKKDKDYTAYVAVENDQVIGVLRANSANAHDKEIFDDIGQKDMSDYVHFKTIYIHPDHQGRGIGKDFISHAAMDALKNGKKKLMTITTDKYEDSPRFFKSFGASFAGRHDVDMKEHYDTTTSDAKDSKLVTNVWVMDAKEVLFISHEKDRKQAEQKNSKIISIINNKNSYNYAKHKPVIVRPIFAKAVGR